MKRTICALLTVLALPAASAVADPVVAVEKVEAYPVSGTTGIELYRSIGERGPKSRNGRAIAVTDYRLTWTRRYVPEKSGCRLAVAEPHLTIITRLPKPSDKLPAGTRAAWQPFIAGITAHEKVHGGIIRETVEAIRTQTAGVTVPNDPGCRKIRTEVTKRVTVLADRMHQKNRDFDATEMGKGGNVQRLILALVNGGRE